MFSTIYGGEGDLQLVSCIVISEQSIIINKIKFVTPYLNISHNILL